MKQYILAFALLLCGAGALAQNPYIAPKGVTESGDGFGVSMPQTILVVDVTAERDMTLCGPYARYAQKFLGVRAPLSDKTVWTVTGAQVALIDGRNGFEAGEPAQPSQRVLSHAVADNEFARLQADKTAMAVPTLEDAARAAAETIFSLRRHRLELITGEAGENVFGEGLRAALDEIARQEQSYLELFLGKHVVTTLTRRFVVHPASDKRQYVVCRFSPADGLLPESDLSGDMVLLQIDAQTVDAAGIEAGAKETNVMQYRVAALATCTVSTGGRELVRTVLPVFEFGRTINVALPRRK